MKCRRQGVDPASYDVTPLGTNITLAKTEHTVPFILNCVINQRDDTNSVQLMLR